MDKLKQQEDWGLLGLKEFAARERSVTLTEKEWGDLSTYILMTTEYREKEQKAWRKLAEQKLSDGTPIIPHAANNAAFWKDMDRKLDRIRRIIEAPYLPPEEVADLCGR